MTIKHEYKGKIIINRPYKSKPRWFIYESDESRFKLNGIIFHPVSTLRQAKNILDAIIIEGDEDET